MKKNDAMLIIDRALDTKSAGIDRNLVKRKADFLKAALREESTVKSFVQMMRMRSSQLRLCMSLIAHGQSHHNGFPSPLG